MPKRPVLLVTRRLPEAVEARARRDYAARLNEDDAQYDADDLVARSDGADAILACSTEAFTADVIARLPASMRAIATFSVGYDHIDIAAANKRGLVVTNTPDVLTAATADVAMLCLLGAARGAHFAASVLRSGKWGRWGATDLLGQEVTGKRIGILGMGRIGRAVARRCRGFDMEIHYHNRSRLAPEQEHGAIYHDSAEGLLPVSQFLSIHCPPSQEMHHFLDARRIALLPDGAVVVNTARGPLLDDEAVIAALRSGKLAAAGLDVYEGEPNFNKGYLDLPNAFLVPHIGSATIETRNAMGFRALDNLDSVFAGHAPADRVQ